MTDSETLFYKADRKSESEWSLQINGRVFGTVKKAVVFNHRGQPVENMCNTYLESTHHSQMYHDQNMFETVYNTNNIANVKNSTVTVTNYSIWGRTITWFFWGDNHVTFSEDFFKTKAIAATFKHIWFSDEYMITIEAGADIDDMFANFVMFSALEYA
ncbi:hypothetical protein Ddc_11544 [Ditylenchus destructor]|nr:hypothetical protein Ddc_11544 [Ditylenchus destructor]